MGSACFSCLGSISDCLFTSFLAPLCTLGKKAPAHSTATSFWWVTLSPTVHSPWNMEGHWLALFARSCARPCNPGWSQWLAQPKCEPPLLGKDLMTERNDTSILWTAAHALFSLEAQIIPKKKFVFLKKAKDFFIRLTSLTSYYFALIYFTLKKFHLYLFSSARLWAPRGQGSWFLCVFFSSLSHLLFFTPLFILQVFIECLLHTRHLF